MMRQPAALVTVAGLTVLLLPTALLAQGAKEIKATYTKYEFRIPMRDGVKLFTAVYVPKDASRPYPILLNRTPYGVGPYGPDRARDVVGPSAVFARSGYIVAYQDVRGRFMSEGQFLHVRPFAEGAAGPKEVNEGTDAYDTIEWLLKNVPNHNGKVGQWGISYPGFYTSCSLVVPHPALVAASPQAPVADWFQGDDWHHNGAFFLAHAFHFMNRHDRRRAEATTKPATPFDIDGNDGYRFFLDLGPLANVDSNLFKGAAPFWNDLMTHGTYDAFWKARDLRPHLKLKDGGPAVMNVAGWFDAENLFGALETYRAFEKSNPKATNSLVIGPWLHGGWSRMDGATLGPVPFDSKTGEFYRDQIEFNFFEHHLKGKDLPAPLPEAWAFENGRNQWRRFDAWPPKTARPRSLYLRSGERLAFEPASSEGSPSFAEYVSDPAKPVPYLDQFVPGMTGDYMVQDQRFASRRPDVLVFQTEPLVEDFTIVGPVRPELFVSTSGTDSDWIVKLIDVYPDSFPDPSPNPAGLHMGGYQQLVRGDVIRGKFRNGLERPEPFTPDEPTRVAFTMPDVLHAFRAGHRIMVQVQSTWFPLVDRNPQTFVDIYHAKDSDFRKATQRVFLGPERASRLEVLELPLGAKP